MSRLADVRRLYELLAELEYRMGGVRRLRDGDGRKGWPARGVYFFFDASEPRTDSGTGARIVRVGTHALRKTSRATLWSRLAQHLGSLGQLGGNHRASIFRALVGEAIAQRDGMQVRTWGHGSSAGAAATRFGVPRDGLIADELELERATSRIIADLRVIALPVEDASARGFIERNSIALLSNFASAPLDPASATWLGQHSQRERVRCSGLWNNEHVDEAYDPLLLASVDEMMRTDADHAGTR